MNVNKHKHKCALVCTHMKGNKDICIRGNMWPENLACLDFYITYLTPLILKGWFTIRNRSSPCHCQISKWPFFNIPLHSSSLCMTVREWSSFIPYHLLHFTIANYIQVCHVHHESIVLKIIYENLWT